ASTNSSLWSTSNTCPNSSSVSPNMTLKQMMALIHSQQALLNQFGCNRSSNAYVPTSTTPTANYVTHSAQFANQLAQQAQSAQQTQMGSGQRTCPVVSHGQPAQQTGSGLGQNGVGQSGLNNAGHETLLPNTFNAMKLQDPTSGCCSVVMAQAIFTQSQSLPIFLMLFSPVISCNKEKPPVLCHACQLGKHVRLPVVSFSTLAQSCFDIVHSDLWTYLISSLYGFKYYVLFLDHYSQFV
ncbi:hypothetical protein Tco_1168006, partial [Tanacetum coccineum]